MLAQNSPSQYFALNMLVAGGVQPSEVNMIYTNDAFAAAAAFAADKQKKIAGAVSWSPDIYNLEKVKGNRMLVNTQTANKLIADIWFARADFAKDHPGMIEALVRGIFDAMEELKKPDRKQECSKLMAAAYNIPADDALKMFDDAHNTNWARELPVLPQPEQSHEFRARLAAVVLSLPADRHDPEPAGAVRPGHGFLGDPEAGRGREIQVAARRVPGAVGPHDRRQDPRREPRDPHEHGRHPLRSQRLGPAQEEATTARSTTPTSTTC